MSFFDQLIEAPVYQAQTLASNLQTNPERALLGINTPLETNVWNKALGTNYQPNMDMLGGPVAQQYGGAQAPAPAQAGLMAAAPAMQQQPQPMPGAMPGYQAQGYAKGGLAGANKQIEQTQVMKVIANYFQNQGLPVEQAMKGVQKEIDNGLQLIPFESSVMGFKPLDETTAQIHFFTVGTMKDLADDMKYFYDYLKKKGIKTVYDSIPAPITTQMFDRLGATIVKSDNPKYKFKATI